MNQLDVRVLGRATSVCVPYLPEMMVCDYLCEILVPTVGLRMDIKRNSVLDSVRYVTKDAVITLNFENRLRKLGDIIPPASKLTVLPLCRDPKLLGNATRADIHASCSICLMPNTNFSTLCHHRFHDTSAYVSGARKHALCAAPTLTRKIATRSSSPSSKAYARVASCPRQCPLLLTINEHTMPFQKTQVFIMSPNKEAHILYILRHSFASDKSWPCLSASIWFSCNEMPP